MIRINKTAEIPESLRTTTCHRYDGQDVQNVLFNDQHGKCYLCEQQTGKNYEIEHLKPKAEGYYPELKFSWTNLFLVCGYCNGRKPNSYEIIDPTENNVEDLIIHKIDLYTTKVEFSDNQSSIEAQQTIDLLTRLFNGKSNIRDKREQILYKDLSREISFFFEMLLQYRSNKNDANRLIIADCLDITKEFLGFKYWIIKELNLYEEFKEEIKWNKH